MLTSNVALATTGRINGDVDHKRSVAQRNSSILDRLLENSQAGGLYHPRNRERARLFAVAA